MSTSNKVVFPMNGETCASKTAFKRFTRDTNVGPVKWGMIGLATYAKIGDGPDVLVAVNPLSSFRLNHSPGTLKVLVRLADMIRSERGGDIPIGPVDGTWPLHSRALDYVLDQAFRWIHASDYPDHHNVQLLDRLRKNVPEHHMPGHYYAPVFVLDGFGCNLTDRGQVTMRLLARSRGWVPSNYDLDAFEAGLFAAESGLKLMVVNTTEGPVLGSMWEDVKVEMILRRGHAPSVINADWFMRLWDYFIPPSMRFCVGSEARLGASLGWGDGSVDADDIDPDEHKVVFMKAAFANYNSTAEGDNMNEGRLSSESTLKQGAKMGGGGSTMGTLEGIDEPVTVGERTLIGALGNAGISLGADCVVAAGVAPQAGQRIYPEGPDEFVQWVLSHRDPDTEYEGEDYVYGRDLSGADGLQITGPALVVRPSKGSRHRNAGLY